MKRYLTLKFLNEKMLRACNGGCCIETDEILFTAPVLRTQKTDDEGIILFLVPEPEEKIQLENSNIALSYHHESGVHIKIHARAVEECVSVETGNTFNDRKTTYLKVKAKILFIEYLETRNVLEN